MSGTAIRGATVVVTGASSGIGAAVARDASRRGAAAVVLVARSADKLAAVADEVRALGATAVVQPCDLTDEGAVGALCADLVARGHVPDLLVNNAGAGRWLALEETPAGEAAEMIAAPYLAAFWTTAGLLPAMLARGRGRVVCVNSPAGLLAIPGSAGYTAARHAVTGMTEALAAELRGTGVGVTHFVVGKVSSPYFDHNPGSEDRIPAIAKLIGTLTPEQTAQRLLDAVQTGRERVYTPVMLAVFVALHQVAPWLVRAFVRVTGWRR